MGITRRLERLESLLQEVNARHEVDAGPAGSGIGIDDAAVVPMNVDLAAEDDGESVTLPEALHARLPVRSHEVAGLEAATDVVESLGLGFHLGSAVERIVVGAGRGREGTLALSEAIWLIERYAHLLEQRPIGADLHRSSAALARTGDSIAGLRALADALAADRHDEMSPTLAQGPPATSAQPPADTHQSFRRELGLIAARWLVIAVSVIVIVLAVTLIADWL